MRCGGPVAVRERSSVVSVGSRKRAAKMVRGAAYPFVFFDGGVLFFFVSNVGLF